LARSLPLNAEKERKIKVVLVRREDVLEGMKAEEIVSAADKTLSGGIGRVAERGSCFQNSIACFLRDTSARLGSVAQYEGNRRLGHARAVRDVELGWTTVLLGVCFVAHACLC